MEQDYYNFLVLDRLFLKYILQSLFFIV